MMKPLPAEREKKVRFELAAEPGSQVFVAGTFNNWNPTANPLKDDLSVGISKRLCVFRQGHTSTSSLSMAPGP